jgi:hypothetical protein
MVRLVMVRLGMPLLATHAGDHFKTMAATPKLRSANARLRRRAEPRTRTTSPRAGKNPAAGKNCCDDYDDKPAPNISISTFDGEALLRILALTSPAPSWPWCA